MPAWLQYIRLNIHMSVFCITVNYIQDTIASSFIYFIYVCNFKIYILWKFNLIINLCFLINIKILYDIIIRLIIYILCKFNYLLGREIKQIITESSSEKRSYKSEYGDEITCQLVTCKDRKVSTLTHDIVAVRTRFYHFRCHILDSSAKRVSTRIAIPLVR